MPVLLMSNEIEILVVLNLTKTSRPAVKNDLFYPVMISRM